MSQNSNNLHTISEINTNSIQNHVTNESALKGIFVAVNVLNSTALEFLKELILHLIYEKIIMKFIIQGPRNLIVFPKQKE